MTEAFAFPDKNPHHLSLAAAHGGEEAMPEAESANIDTFYGSLEQYCTAAGMAPSDVTDEHRLDFSQLLHDWTSARARTLPAALPQQPRELPRPFLEQAWKEHSLRLNLYRKQGRNDAIRTERFRAEQKDAINLALPYKQNFPQILVAVAIYEEFRDRDMVPAATSAYDLLAVYGRAVKIIHTIRLQAEKFTPKPH